MILSIFENYAYEILCDACLPVLMYPIDEDEPSVDGINLTVGATRTFSVWIICNGFLSFDHSTSHLYLPGNEFKNHFSPDPFL